MMPAALDLEFRSSIAGEAMGSRVPHDSGYAARAQPYNRQSIASQPTTASRCWVPVDGSDTESVLRQQSLLSLALPISTLGKRDWGYCKHLNVRRL